MRSSSRLVLRKMKKQLPQFIGIVLLLSVGVSFFITLFTIVMEYEVTAEQFFIDHTYADVTFYGAFDDEDITLLSEFDGIVSVEGRTVRDFRNDEQTIRTISLTDNINTLFLDEGRLPENRTETVILTRNAEAMGLSIGDGLLIESELLTITGLVASVEYIYLVQNERTIAMPEDFGVTFVTADFFEGPYNEVVAMIDADFDIAIASEALGAFHTLERYEQTNYQLYRDDLEQFATFAYIFPLIFAILIGVVVYITLSRTIQKDRKQIGTMKALGATDGKIISLYLLQVVVVSLLGALIGCILAIFLTDVILGFFASMFVVPTLSFAFHPLLWLTAIVVSILLCVLSALIVLFSILPLLPAHAMRPRLPKGGSQILIERTALWKKFTFNTRYALKNALRNKSRFLAVVLGMCASCALLIFTLGFRDSFPHTADEHFNHFVNYDIMISFDLLPLSTEHTILEQVEESSKALMLPVEVKGENHILTVVENDFDMVQIPMSQLQSGIVIPEFFADTWDVGVGERLEINGDDVVISAVTTQVLGLTLYTSFDYLNQVTDDVPMVYNTIFGRTSDLQTLSAYLIENNIEFTTLADDQTSFDTIMEALSVLVLFLIACAVILGVTVLYSVGMINLSAREYEYLFMGVMGYAHKSILLAHIKETIVQLILAIPLGFLLGHLLLESVRSEFSNNSFVIQPTIFSQSYLIATLVVLSITALMGWVTSRHIEKLDIVEGLKAQDD